MKMTAWLLALTCLLAASCNRNDDNAAAGSLQPPAQSADARGTQRSERTWAGLLPCSDCQGIDTRLVLRFGDGQRDYLMTETYLGGPGKTSFNRAGTWTETTRVVDGESATLYILDPDQAGQRFSLQADGALELLDGNGNEPAQALAYRLQRL